MIGRDFREICCYYPSSVPLKPVFSSLVDREHRGRWRGIYRPFLLARLKSRLTRLPCGFGLT